MRLPRSIVLSEGRAFGLGCVGRVRGQRSTKRVRARRSAPGYFLASDFFAMLFLGDFFLDVPATFFARVVTALAADVSARLTVVPFLMEGVFFLAALLMPPLEVAINESFLTEVPDGRRWLSRSSTGPT